MARAGTMISVAIALLLIGSSAESIAKNAAGASLSSTAAAVTQRPWSIAERPRYVMGGWTCSPGLVWRSAGSTDWLCVDPGEAERIEAENAAAADNWVQGMDGAQTCRAGLVRREAFKRDSVCVDPARRDAIHEMNTRGALYIVR